MKIPCKITLLGNKDCAQKFIGAGQSQLRILENQMSFQDLKQGTRKVRLSERVTVEALVCFGLKEVIIYCLPVGEILEKVEKETSFVALAGTHPYGRIFRSIDLGKTWEKIFDSTEPTIYCLTHGKKVCLAGTGTDGKIYKSTDYGKNWNLKYISPGHKDMRTLTHVKNGIFLVGTQGPTPEIRRSTNYGDTWSAVDTFGFNYIQSITYLENGICLMSSGGTTPATIYRSTDYGVTWNYAATPIAGENIIFGLTYLGNGICAAGTANNGHIIRSTDYGQTWIDIGTLSHSGLNAISIQAITYVGNGVCIAGATLQDPGIAWYPTVFRSTDYGVTWSFIYQNSMSDEFRVLAYIGKKVLVGGLFVDGGPCCGGDRIIRSADNGLTWTDLGSIGHEYGVLSLTALETEPMIVQK